MSGARVQGYAALLVLPVAILIVSGIQAASVPGGFDYLRFVVGAFPASVGLIASAVTLEVGLARGRGRGAIRTSVTLGGLFALVNLLLLLAVLHGLRVI